MSYWKELDSQHFMDTGHRRLGVVITRGRGSRVWDEDGREYLDFIGGWAVTSLGHCHPVIVNALKAQAEQLLIGSWDVYTIPQIELADLLLSRTAFSKALFVNGGAEANEAAVKLARKYGKLHLGGAYEVISTLNSFHGRTLAMVAATGKPSAQEPFTPLPEGFVNVPFDDVDAIKEATTERTCAVLLESIQGEGGVNIPSPGYLKEVRQWCHRNGLLFILDEVQTGCGRTGTLFAYEQFGAEPDILAIGKGLGGGVPIAGLLIKEHAAVFGPGDHGSTYGGNPLVCAAALANLRYILTHDLAGGAARMGAYFKERLEGLRQRHRSIKEVRGRGLLLAIELAEPLAADVVAAARDNGLLLNLNREGVIRVMPPLTVSRDEIDEAVEILVDAMVDASAAPVLR